MFYDAQLEFLQNTLNKKTLQTAFFCPSRPVSEIGSLSRRDFFSDSIAGNMTFYEMVPQLRPNTFFKMTDAMLRSYIFCLLPETEEETVLFIGPYLRENISETDLNTVAGRFSVPPEEIHRLE